MPCVGMKYLITVMLSPLSSRPMSCCLPFQLLDRSMTLVEYSSGTCTSTNSKGSSFFPVPLFVLSMTLGEPTLSGKMRTVRWSCPQLLTAYLLAELVSLTWRAIPTVGKGTATNARQLGRRGLVVFTMRPVQARLGRRSFTLLAGGSWCFPCAPHLRGRTPRATSKEHGASRQECAKTDCLQN